MITYDEALAAVLGSIDKSSELVAPIAEEPVAIANAFARYLSQPVSASMSLPSYTQSAMDGYAVRVSDLQKGQCFPISQRVAAGEVAKPLEPSTVARVFTGAMLPTGADAVIIQENTELRGSDNGNRTVHFCDDVRLGQNVRQQGEECQAGEYLLAAGRRLSAADIGLLVAAGVSQLMSVKPLKVAVFTTGNELVQPGQSCSVGQIYNSNQSILHSSLLAMGMECIDLGICPDSAEATQHFLQQAAAVADCIISTGGMSVGEEDYVKDQVSLLGNIDFWKLAIKPGKPFAFGDVLGKPFFGLPGNAVSAFVTFNLLVKPWLLKRIGASFEPATIQAKSDFNRKNNGLRQEFVRANVIQDASGQWRASLYAKQASSIISSLAFTNALIAIAPGRVIQPGDEVSAMVLSPERLF